MKDNDILELVIRYNVVKEDSTLVSRNIEYLLEYERIDLKRLVDVIKNNIEKIKEELKWNLM